MDGKQINIIGISGRIESGKDTIGSMIQNIVYEPFRDDTQPTFEDWNNQAWKCLLEKESSWEIKKFSYKIKQIASLLTGIPVEKFEDREFKNSLLDSEWSLPFYDCPLKAVDPFNDVNFSKNITIREFLQKLGTEAIREGLHNNAWINALWADCNEECKWIITDCRFKNEAESIKQRGGVIVRLTRNSFKKATHKSETELDKYKFDYVINNEHLSIEKTYNEVEMMLKYFKIIY